MPELTFALSAELAPARLDGLSRELIRELGRAGVPAKPVEAKAGPGERGVLSTVGSFVIDTLTNGKAIEMATSIVKAYLAREKSLHVSVVKSDGTKIEIDAKNVGSAAVAEFLGAAKTFMA
jgi:hypothetical protein